jgi:hypothetical protein
LINKNCETRAFECCALGAERLGELVEYRTDQRVGVGDRGAGPSMKSPSTAVQRLR